MKARPTCSYNDQVDLLHGNCLDERSSRAEEKQQTRGKGRNDLCNPNGERRAEVRLPTLDALHFVGRLRQVPQLKALAGTVRLAFFF
jgi:hypothetical protein